MTREETIHKWVLPALKNTWNEKKCEEILKALEQEPNAGHWIFDDKCKEHGHCSQCGYGSVDLVNGEPHNFCRNCGCRMVGSQESEDKE